MGTPATLMRAATTACYPSNGMQARMLLDLLQSWHSLKRHIPSFPPTCLILSTKARACICVCLRHVSMNVDITAC
eukprot:5676416-Amphidinium_carterae.1